MSNNRTEQLQAIKFKEKEDKINQLKKLREWGAIADCATSLNSHKLYESLNRKLEPGKYLFSHEVPFFEISSSIVETAFSSLTSPDPENIFSSEILDKLTGALIKRVGQLLTEPLLDLFNEFRAESGQKSFSASSDTLHSMFQDDILENPAKLFRRYPPIHQILAEFLENYWKNIANLSCRLKTDTPEIADIFGIQGKPVELELGLSDPHNGHQAVIIIKFKCGKKLVYKPRDVRSDIVLNQIIEFASNRLEESQLNTYRVLNKGEYGWCEFIESQPCQSAAEVLDAAKNAGRMLFIAYFLNMTDCHLENVIANRESIYLIDGETICTSRAKPLGWPEVNYSNNNPSEIVDESVIRTGLVPQLDIDEKTGSARDVSGYGATAASTGESSIPQVIDANTDAARIELQLKSSVSNKVSNLPVFNGMQVDLSEHIDHVIYGFEEAYRVFMSFGKNEQQHLTELLKECTTRFVFRNTFVYWTIRNECLKAKHLRSFEERNRTLMTALGRPFLEAESRPHNFNVFIEEVASMQRGDIPYFLSRPDSMHLYRTDGTIVCSDFFEETGIQKVKQRLRDLSENDLRVQLTIIRGAFTALQSGRSDIEHKIDFSMNDSHPSDDQFNSLIRQQSEYLADSTEQCVHWIDSNYPCFISFKYVSSVGRFQLAPMGWSLYDGQMGVALSLASFDQNGGSLAHSKLIEAILNQLENRVFRPVTRVARPLVEDIGLGGFTGIGSILYALVELARLSSDYQDQCRLISEQIIESISDELIFEDTVLDQLGGISGLASSLLCTYHQFGNLKAKHLAEICGDRLIETAVETPIGGKAWKGIESLPLTGFSHGAAGNVLALVRLYQEFGDEKLLNMAKSGIEFEDNLFSETEGNWRDLRGGTDWSELNNIPQYQTSWCHGSPGILLSRIECIRLLPTEFAWSDHYQNALEHIMEYSAQDSDHICCGEMGRINTLRTAAEFLHDDSLKVIAERKCYELLKRAVDKGGYRLLPGVNENTLHLGFFQGISGILHALNSNMSKSFPMLLR